MMRANGPNHKTDLTLCNACGKEIPSALATRIRSQIYPLRATMSAWAFDQRVCNAHELELIHEPLARARGWPFRPDFYVLPLRVDSQHDEISILFEEPTESLFFSRAIASALQGSQGQMESMCGHSGA
jgi:hypothetical protein